MKDGRPAAILFNLRKRRIPYKYCIRNFNIRGHKNWRVKNATVILIEGRYVVCFVKQNFKIDGNCKIILLIHNHYSATKWNIWCCVFLLLRCLFFYFLLFKRTKDIWEIRQLFEHNYRYILSKVFHHKRLNIRNSWIVFRLRYLERALCPLFDFLRSWNNNRT